MSRAASAWSSFAVAAGLLLGAREVQAQVWNPTIATAEPARLAANEIALVGLTVKATDSLGMIDSAMNFIAAPKGAYTLNFEQDLFAILRVLNKGEVGVVVPFMESRFQSPGGDGTTSDVGGGLGDVRLSARANVIHTTPGSHLPGVAVLFGMTFPTGRSPSAPNTGPLGADITGTGAYQMNVGVSVEELLGSSFQVAASGVAAQRFATTVDGVHERLATEWSAKAGVSYLFSNSDSLGVSGSYVTMGEPTIDGVVAAGFGRRSVNAELFTTIRISDRWRFQASIYSMLPLERLGWNQSTVPIGLSLTIIKSWL